MEDRPPERQHPGPALTPSERRALDDLERRLAADDPVFHQVFGERGRVGRAVDRMVGRRRTGVDLALVVLGSLLGIGGLVATAVLASFLGFVLALAGLTSLSAHPAAGRLLSWFVRVLGVSDGAPTEPSS